MINSLDTASLGLVVAKLPNCAWTYQEIKEAITAEFGNPETVVTMKMESQDIFFKVDKALEKSSGQVYATS